MDKFKLTRKIKIDGKFMYRLKALKSFKVGGIEIKIGDLGGYVENEENLSHDGNCWIDRDCKIYGNSRIYGDVLIKKSVITDSTIKINSHTQSSIENCKIFNSIINGSDLTLIDTIIEDSIVTNTNDQLDENYITDSSIFHSKIINSGVEESQINQSKIVESFVMDSTITLSELNYSAYWDGSTFNSIINNNSFISSIKSSIPIRKRNEIEEEIEGVTYIFSLSHYLLYANDIRIEDLERSLKEKNLYEKYKDVLSKIRKHFNYIWV